jgi:hypothetical protein
VLTIAAGEPHAMCTYSSCTCLLQVALAQQQFITRNLTVCWVDSPVSTLTIDLLADTVPGARAVTNLRAVRIPQVGTGARAGTTYVLTASVDPGEAGRTAVLTYFVTPPTGPRMRVKINILVLQTGARSVCLEAARRRFSTPTHISCCDASCVAVSVRWLCCSTAETSQLHA